MTSKRNKVRSICHSLKFVIVINLCSDHVSFLLGQWRFLVRRGTLDFIIICFYDITILDFLKCWFLRVLKIAIQMSFPNFWLFVLAMTGSIKCIFFNGVQPTAIAVST